MMAKGWFGRRVAAKGAETAHHDVAKGGRGAPGVPQFVYRRPLGDDHSSEYAADYYSVWQEPLFGPFSNPAAAGQNLWFAVPKRGIMLTSPRPRKLPPQDQVTFPLPDGPYAAAGVLSTTPLGSDPYNAPIPASNAGPLVNYG
jgi:hypothetical protein